MRVTLSSRSSVCCDSRLLGRNGTIEYLLPQLLVLLRDNAPAVRLSVISHLNALHHVVDVESISQSIVPAITELSADSKWRVRLAIIELIPLLARQLGHGFFTDQMSGLCLNWLTDRVYTVRRAATDNLKELTQLFGSSWAIRYVLPRIDTLTKEESYLLRVTALYALQVLIETFELSPMLQHLYPRCSSLMKDDIANVRFTACKALLMVYQRLHRNRSEVSTAVVTQTCQEIQSAMDDHAQDSDRDVKQTAVEVCTALSPQLSSLFLIPS